MEEASEIGQTKQWITNVVLALNLCPFAHSVFNQNKIHYLLSLEHTLENIKHCLLEEISYLEENDAISTSFIILPKLLSFMDYLDVLDNLNKILAQTQFNKKYQLASFHPNYLFQGSTENDPANYTNRSPFPMFHILREKELTRGIDSFPNTENIPEDNIKLLREMGLKEIQKILNESKNH